MKHISFIKNIDCMALRLLRKNWKADNNAKTINIRI